MKCHFVILFFTFEKHKTTNWNLSIIMITKATLEDVSSLNKLINSAYRGESSKKGWTTEANILEGGRTTEIELTEIIQDKKNTILKFTENNQIIGCVLLIEKEDRLYLGMLTVSPELQNSGIGKKVLQQAEIHASTLGLSKIVMTVITVREELIAWYKRHGYIDTGAREPFPVSEVFSQTSNEPLEFMVLEKRIS
jgi:ribosomal protein S18 acetylase RimI-like enzyme